jgi:type II secretory pathway pseudopilin PulG
MSKHDIGLAILSTVVIVVIISAFNLTGSPLEKQKQARDQKKLSTISSLSYSVQDYYRRNKALPQNLDQITKTMSDKDSLKSTQYVYQSLTATTYNLCTTFETDTKKDQKKTNSANLYIENPDTTHPEGYYCIKYTIPSSLAPSPSPITKSLTIPSSSNIIKTTNKAQISGTTANWLHETAETNTLLVVTAAYRAHNSPDASIESLSYNGAKLTKARRDHFTDRTSEIWYLVNPPIINSQITVQFTKDPESQAFSAVSVRNVNTSSPVYTTYGSGSNAQNSTKSATDSALLITAPGDLVLGVVADYPDGGTNYLTTKGRSLSQWSVYSPDQNIKNNGITQVASSSSETISWTSRKDYSRAYSFIVIKLLPKTSTSY